MLLSAPSQPSPWKLSMLHCAPRLVYQIARVGVHLPDLLAIEESLAENLGITQREAPTPA